MKILHTSDWHIGRMLYGKKRYREFAQFLDWMVALIQKEMPEILIIAGDIFDTTTPSHRAQKLYYQFLARISVSGCRHVVIIGGNHDSPSLLNAPRTLLEALNVYVISDVNNDDLEREVLELVDETGDLEAIVCAVPFLRDRHIRRPEAGERFEESEKKRIAGINEHYQKIATLAQAAANRASKSVSIIGTGHLFTTGGHVTEESGERDLYVGNLGNVSAEIFADTFDYVALGHLHIPQRVNQCDHIRYSGSPLAMSFGEARQQKIVCCVEFNGKQPQIREIPIPTFQALVAIRGDDAEIIAQLEELAQNDSMAWVEIDYDGDSIQTLKMRLEEIAKNASFEILRIKNKRVITKLLTNVSHSESLDDLDPLEVFQLRLDDRVEPQKNREILMHYYREIYQAILDRDSNAE